MQIIQSIQTRIYEVRGERIMFDFDLAGLYEVETKIFNQAVKRNIKRFPKDFMFQLTGAEWNSLKTPVIPQDIEVQTIGSNRSQIVTGI
ncbi:MAG TPA: ORF6N domain-containing protein [Agriterribacter sp.]|nr:ORF6N domain-containing protein [Agriterribacter sp.]